MNALLLDDIDNIKLQKDIDILKKILTDDYSYPESSLSKDIKFGSISFSIDLGIFKKNCPHSIDNLLIACDSTSDTIETCLEKMKQISSVIKKDFLNIYYKDEDMRILKYYEDNDNIEPHFTIPVYGKEIHSLYKKDLILTDDLLRVIEIIHNHIYANEGFSSNEVFNELIKILMIKFVDEQKEDDENLEFYISEVESETLDTDKNNLFLDRINKLYETVTERYSNLFSKEDSLKLSPKVLAFTIAQLQRYNLFDMDNDVKGLVFQKVINRGQKGERGQFFTPDPIVDFMVKFIKPQKHQIVLDPACGTGSFLRQVISYLRKEYGQDNDIKDHIDNNIFGIEINPNISRVANLRFIFEGSNTSNVVCHNALDDFENLEDANIEKGKYDLILTNPPFGSQGKITDKKLLSKFDLGYKLEKKLSGQVPDILFIERCIDLLKEGGKLGIVLPDGDFENPSLTYVRDYIKSRCNILAVVKLPEQSFVPFGTGVKASILFLKKKGNVSEQIERKVFFAKIDKLGYSYNKNANLVYKKDPNGSLILNEDNHPIIDEDYSDIIKCYEDFKMTGNLEEREKCFCVNESELDERFDFEFYEPRFINNIKLLNKLGAVPLSSIAKIIKRKSDLLKEKDKMVRYIEISDINPSYSEVMSCSELPVHDLPSRASYHVNTGDVLTSVAGNAIGTSRHASAIVSEKFDNSICTNGLRVVRPFAVDPYYLLYYLRSEYFLNQVLRFRTGAAIPSISDEDFNNILVILPNDNVMESISQKVKLSYELREKARAMLDIDLDSIINSFY